MLKTLLLLSFFLTSLNTLPSATQECSAHSRSSCDDNIPEAERAISSTRLTSIEVFCAPPSKRNRPAALITNPGSRKPSVWIVKMIGMRFEPRIIEITAGDSVKWVNESNAYHNTVSADRNIISDMLKKEHPFNFHLSDPVHSNITASHTVGWE